MIISIDLNATGREIQTIAGEHGYFHNNRLLVSVTSECAKSALEHRCVRAANEGEVVAWCDHQNERSQPKPRRAGGPSTSVNSVKTAKSKGSSVRRRGGPLAAHWRVDNDD